MYEKSIVNTSQIRLNDSDVLHLITCHSNDFPLLNDSPPEPHASAKPSTKREDDVCTRID